VRKIILFLFLFFTHRSSYAENISDASDLVANYVEACDAMFHLKMTHCRNIKAQKTTSCLRKSISSFSKKQKKILIESIKPKLIGANIKTQVEVQVNFEKLLNDNNQDANKTCLIYSNDLKNIKNFQYEALKKFLETSNISIH